MELGRSFSLEGTHIMTRGPDPGKDGECAIDTAKKPIGTSVRLSSIGIRNIGPSNMSGSMEEVIVREIDNFLWNEFEQFKGRSTEQM